MSNPKEPAVGTAFREFFEESINVVPSSQLLKNFGILSKQNNHIKFVCGNQVYYITNANIFTDPSFHNINGNVQNNNGLTNINLSQFSSNNIFNAVNFINTRGTELRNTNHSLGLYEMYQLIPIDLKDLRTQLGQYYNINNSLRGFRYNGLVVRGDLKKCIRNGLLNYF